MQRPSPTILLHHVAVRRFLFKDLSQRRVRILFPFLRCALMQLRLNLFGAILVRRWPLKFDLLILSVPVRPITQCFP